MQIRSSVLIASSIIASLSACNSSPSKTDTAAPAVQAAAGSSPALSEMNGPTPSAVMVPVATPAPLRASEPARTARPAPVAPANTSVAKPVSAPISKAAPVAVAPALSARPSPTIKPATRPAVSTLKFSPASIDAIQAGTKTSTTRKGVRKFPDQTAIADDGKRTLKLVIVSTVQKKMNQLSAEDAMADGSESVDAMKKATTKNYAGIADDDLMTVITFRVAN